jgi:hypothetical protein
MSAQDMSAAYDYESAHDAVSREVDGWTTQEVRRTASASEGSATGKIVSVVLGLLALAGTVFYFLLTN